MMRRSASFANVLLLTICVISSLLAAALSFNVPPTIVLHPRSWKLLTSEPVGGLIDRARVQTIPGISSPVTFGLEESQNEDIDGLEFFRIDSRTGKIYLNKSLEDEGGKTFYLYVTATSGSLTSKVEVQVEVEEDDLDDDDDETDSDGVEDDLLISPSTFRPTDKSSVFNIPHRVIANPLPPWMTRPIRPSSTTPAPSPPSPEAPEDSATLPASPEPSPIATTEPSVESSPSSSPETSPSTVNPTTKRPRKRNRKKPKPSTTTSPESTTLSSATDDSSSTSPEQSVDENVIEKSSTSPDLPGAVLGTVSEEDPRESNSVATYQNSASSGSVSENEKKTPPTLLTAVLIPSLSVALLLLFAAILIWAVRKRRVRRRKKEGSVRYKTSADPDPHVKGEINPVGYFSGEGTGSSSFSPSAPLYSPGGRPLWSRAVSNRYELEPGSNPTPVHSVPRVGDFDKWEFPRHQLIIQGILGEGYFGQVWKCDALMMDGTTSQTVAVKTLKENASERERLDLLAELNLMKTLDAHPNVVTLLGCCTEKDPIFLVMEYVVGGKLQSYLRASRAEHYYSKGGNHAASRLSSKDLLGFAYGTARGMDYLSKKGIIHRDLAARNVLVGEGKVAKVADFGFARDLIGKSVYERKSEGKLPIRWMSPESLYDNIFTAKSDVWSFGVLLWEIVTLGSTPYPGMGASEVMKKVRDGYRLEKPDHCRREVYNLMYYCWHADPRERPSFEELVHSLEDLLAQETEYIEMEHFPDHNYYNILSNLSGEKL